MKTNKKEAMLMVFGLGVFAVSPLAIQNVSKHEMYYHKKAIYRSIAQEQAPLTGIGHVTVQDSTRVHIVLPQVKKVESSTPEIDFSRIGNSFAPADSTRVNVVIPQVSSHQNESEDNCDAEHVDECQFESNISQLKLDAELIKSRQDKVKAELEIIAKEAKEVNAKLEARKAGLSELASCQDQDTCGHIEIYEKEAKEMKELLAKKLSQLTAKNDELHSLSIEIEAKKEEAKNLSSKVRNEEELVKLLKEVSEELKCLAQDEDELDTMYANIAESIQKNEREVTQFIASLQAFTPETTPVVAAAQTTEEAPVVTTAQASTESRESSSSENSETEALRLKIEELERKLSERENSSRPSQTTASCQQNDQMASMVKAMQSFVQTQTQLLTSMVQQNQQFNNAMIVALLQGNHNNILTPTSSNQRPVGEVSMSLKDLFSIFPTMNPYQVNNYYGQGYNPNGYQMNTPQQNNANPMFNFSAPMQNSWVYDANLTTPQWGNFQQSNSPSGSNSNLPTGIGQALPAFFNGQRS